MRNTVKNGEWSIQEKQACIKRNCVLYVRTIEAWQAFESVFSSKRDEVIIRFKKIVKIFWNKYNEVLFL